MDTLIWIVIFGLAMSAIALVGSLTLALPESLFKKIIYPLVSLAAGSLIGGAIFHLLPHAIEHLGNTKKVYITLISGFVLMFILEQFLHWHHCHRSILKHKPVSYLILLADALHNFVGGLSIGAAFVIDIRLGIITWCIAAVHEIPQELGDFGILIHSGWKPKSALLFNLISALTFPIGSILAYSISEKIDISTLLAFGAGNFLYIGAADLVPQLNTHKTKNQIILFFCFVLSLSIMLLTSNYP